MHMGNMRQYKLPSHPLLYISVASDPGGAVGWLSGGDRVISELREQLFFVVQVCNFRFLLEFQLLYVQTAAPRCVFIPVLDKKLPPFLLNLNLTHHNCPSLCLLQVGSLQYALHALHLEAVQTSAGAESGCSITYQSLPRGAYYTCAPESALVPSSFPDAVQGIGI